MQYPSIYLKLTLFISSLCLLLSACGGSSSGSSAEDENTPPSMVTGQVLNYQDDTAIANAMVNIRYGSVEIEMQTNSAGQFSFSPFSTTERVTLSADAEDYSENAVIIATNQPLSEQLVIRLQPNDLNMVFDATETQSFTLNNLSLLDLPANALVDANGNTFTGSASVEIKVLDPALDSSIMPGDYRVQPVGNTSEILESFGALAVTFDSASGALNLGTGEQATIRIPVSSLYATATPPATMPLYYFNEETGYWVEEGLATLETDSASGKQVYVGQVSHFTVWNADQPITTVTLEGCVFNSAQIPLANVRIFAEGRTYIGSSSTYSDQNGCYSLPVRIDSDLILYFSGNSESFVLEWNSQNLNVRDVILEDAALISKLSWGTLPEDLDAHFITPAGEVYFGNEAVQDNNTGFNAFLDVDDTSSFGPEVISSSAFTLPGCYEYYVHNYSESTAWDETNAKVNVSIDGEQRQFLINQVSASNAEFDDVYKLWSVFTVEVDNNLNTTIQWRNQLVDQTFCEGDAVIFSLEENIASQAVRARSRTNNTAKPAKASLRLKQ